MTTVTAAAIRNPIQTRVDRMLGAARPARNRAERQAEREIAYSDHLKVLLDDIRARGKKTA